MTDARCSGCGEPVRADLRFCTSCGSETTSSCPSCSTVIEVGDAFCTSCGYRTGPNRCGVCGSSLEDDAEFCTSCGARVGSLSHDRRKKRWLVPILVVAVVGSIAVAALIWILSSQAPTAESEDTVIEAESTAGPSTVVDVSTTSTTQPTTTTGAPSTSTTSSTTVIPETRLASLYSDFAKLRSSPHIEAAEITTLTGEGGSIIELQGPHFNGWYEIDFDGIKGWIFGTFVLPPDPGLLVAETRDGATAQLLNQDGGSLGVANESGPKVLVVSQAGMYWQVLLPDGGTGWIDPDEFVVVGG